MQRQSKKNWIRKIDFVFYNEQEIREQVADARNNLQHAPVIRNASKIPDPTAKEAIFNLTPITSIRIKGKELKRPEDWLRVVDATYFWAQQQDNPRYQVAKLRFSGEDYRMMCAKCHISARYQYTLLDNFRGYAASQARDLELILKEEFEEIFL